MIAINLFNAGSQGIDNLLELQLELGKNARLIEEGNQLEEQLKQIDNQIEQLQETEVDTNDRVDVFLKLNEPLNSFMQVFNYADNEKVNALLHKYIDRIINDKKHNKLQVFYTKEVQQILVLVG
jgi:predicted YcjX-like family ATPase